jgi:hypothetical protein
VRKADLFGEVRGPECSTSGFYMLADNLVLRFEPPMNLIKAMWLGNAGMGLMNLDTIDLRHVPLMSAEESDLVIGGTRLYVLRDDRLRVIVDDSPHATAAVLWNRLYRLVADSTGWHVDAIALPP